MKRLAILIRHVHGGYMNAFVRSNHDVLLPVIDGSPRGRRRPEWPANAREVTAEQARDLHVDAVIYQSAGDVVEFEQWLRGRAVKRIFLEHNSPQGRINEMRHPAADRDDMSIVHVTHFNALFWDCGSTPARVIEHGIPDPGYRFSGELQRCSVVINEAQRRARVTGTDLLERFADVAPYDLFGIGALDIPYDRLYDEIARRRIYLHPNRWTSLGLSLLEAMHVGAPVVALATTEVAYAVPEGAGFVSNRIDVLQQGIRTLMSDHALARDMGLRAREHALHHYGLHRFLCDWDNALAGAVESRLSHDAQDTELSTAS